MTDSGIHVRGVHLPSLVEAVAGTVGGSAGNHVIELINSKNVNSSSSGRAIQTGRTVSRIGTVGTIFALPRIRVALCAVRALTTFDSILG